MPSQQSVLCVHDTTLQECINIVMDVLPNAKIKGVQSADAMIIEVSLGKIPANDPVIKMRFRERLNPAITLERVECPVTQRLAGLLNFAQQVKTSNENLRYLLNRKIVTLNYEISFQSDDGGHGELLLLATAMNSRLDGIMFCFPGTILSKSEHHHLLDCNMNMIFDTEGRSEVDDLKVAITQRFYKPGPKESTEETRIRKQDSINMLRSRGLRFIEHLPELESEQETELRTPKEIGERLVALWIVMLIAFEHAESDDLLGFLETHELSYILTPKELEFIRNPTPESRSINTWKCECIWLLMWALKVVDDLPFPDSMAQLDHIPPSEHPVMRKTDPKEFISRHTTMRSKKEILDVADLYYRVNWLARNNNLEGIEHRGYHPGVIWERYYAMNWLRKFGNSDWDDVDIPS